MKDYYKVLGISREATPAMIKAAYHARLHQHQLDTLKGDETFLAMEQLLEEAFDTLSHRERREKYDKTLESWDRERSAQAEQDVYARYTGKLRQHFSFGRDFNTTLNSLFLISLFLLSVSFLMKGRLPLPVEIAPELRQDPKQAPINEPEFEISYRGRNYEIKPVATYELWSVVVSHNDTAGFGDIYHDENSLDTRDFCVVWGRNLNKADYHQAKYTSGSFTCYCSWPPGITVYTDQLANNHLITDNPEIRRKINRIRIGDQIYLAGMLVNYRDVAKGGWRSTSLVRNDQGCEVVFVQKLEILKAETHGWHALFSWAFWLVILIPITKLIYLLGQGFIWGKKGPLS